MHWPHLSNATRRERVMKCAQGEVTDRAELPEEPLTEALQTFGAVSLGDLPPTESTYSASEGSVLPIPSAP